MTIIMVITMKISKKLKTTKKNTIRMMMKMMIFLLREVDAVENRLAEEQVHPEKLCQLNLHLIHYH